MNMYTKYTNMILNTPINRSTLEFGKVMVHGKPKMLCYQTVSYWNMRRILCVVSCCMHTFTYFVYTLQHRNGAFIPHFCIAIIYSYACFKVSLKYIYVEPWTNLWCPYCTFGFILLITQHEILPICFFFSISTRRNLCGNTWIV